MKYRILVIFAFAFVLALAVNTAVAQEAGEGGEPVDEPPPVKEIPVDKAARICAIMEKARPAVAFVKFNIRADAGKDKVECCGVVVSENGLVMVGAKHFDDKYAQDDFVDFEVQLELADGPKTYDAAYLGKDPAARVAMLRLVKKEDDEKFAFATFDDEAALEVGDEVVVVAFLGKDFNRRRDYRLGRVTAVIEKPVLQYSLTPSASHEADAVIFTLDGKAVGILKDEAAPKSSSGSPGRGRGGFTFVFRGFGSSRSESKPVLLFPSRHFSKVIADPPKPEVEKAKAWLGLMGLQDLTKELAEFWGMGEKKGVIVGHVIVGGPGEAIALKAEDVIIAINGRKLESDLGTAVTALKESLKKMAAGDKVTLTVYRGGGEIELSGTLGAEPKRLGKARKVKFEEEFKFTVRELVFFDPYNRDLPKDQPGCIVHYIESGWAADGGLKTGDIITKVGETAVKDVGHFGELFDAAVGKKPKEIILSVLRGKTNQAVVVRIECHWK